MAFLPPSAKVRRAGGGAKFCVGQALIECNVALSTRKRREVKHLVWPAEKRDLFDQGVKGPRGSEDRGVRVSKAARGSKVTPGHKCPGLCGQTKYHSFVSLRFSQPHLRSRSTGPKGKIGQRAKRSKGLGAKRAKEALNISALGCVCA